MSVPGTVQHRWALVLALAAAACAALGCGEAPTAAPASAKVTATGHPAAHDEIDPSTCPNGWIIANGKVQCL